MEYRVTLTESAKKDIAHFDVPAQRMIVAGISTHLKADAEVPTRRKKPLRPNPIAPWELRLDRFRVFYSIEEDDTRRLLRWDTRNTMTSIFRGRRVQL
jgi:mRNA-degrading endonuclease RelE of RelBE toxin-antitoxin system